MKKFEIRIFLDGRYYVRRISANNSAAAVAALEEKINTAMEYRIVSVKELVSKKLYVAYGSNLHLAQMASRCPDAKVYGSGVIKNYRLAFYRVASILPEPGAEVPVGVWTISPQDEKNLDRYEGFPHLYRKEIVNVVMENGKTVAAMAYVMNRGGMETPPGAAYYNTIHSGYRAFGLDTAYLEKTVKNIADSWSFAGI
ncbi:MAG: gamma-glutamylcyclotransferase [bacterium]|nr:gamma-glutamylcyclotransferase [bacterium]